MKRGRVRLSGSLTRGKRGLILSTDDDQVWVVETDRPVELLIGKRVAAEGNALGIDRLVADWIGEATA